MESKKLLKIENELCAKLETLKFKAPVEFIYNPLRYARNLHEVFVNKYFENSTKKILFLGMNPGPWGMCQTGIVFGEKDIVTNWLEVTGSVEKPDKEHPKRRVMGLKCHRSEVSGKKFWKFFKTLCGKPQGFFKHSFVYNFCPLTFLNSAGTNITPPEIKDLYTRKALNNFCDEAFIKIIKEFNFEIVIPIGKFAERSALKTLKENQLKNIRVCSIPHPSPRNAKNWSNWEQVTFQKLLEYNLVKYFTEKQGNFESLFCNKLNNG